MTSKEELRRKINSCGECKETSVGVLMCDKQWDECKKVIKKHGKTNN